MDRAGILPLKLYETDTDGLETSQFEFTNRRRKSSTEAKVMSRLIQMRTPAYQTRNNEQVDSFRDSDSDSEEKVHSTLETTSIIRPTRLERVRWQISCRRESQKCEVVGRPGTYRYKLATCVF